MSKLVKPNKPTRPVIEAPDDVKMGRNDAQEVQDGRVRARAHAKAISMQNFMVFCDGTGNNALDDGKQKTNVYRLFKCVANKDSAGRPQVAIYQQGIGTTPEISGNIFVAGLEAVQKTADKLSGNSTLTEYAFQINQLITYAIGIEANIAILYWAICGNFREGDKLFLFGFSRGGYTVRLLASLVADLGIVDSTDLQSKSQQIARCVAVVKKWKQYRGSAALDKSIRNLKPIKEKFTPVDSIEVVGVWDTVSSLGAPDLGDSNFQSADFKFAENLRDIIQNAFQALALTERRTNFKPVVWKNIPNEGKQCWFVGHHSAIGGGNKQIGVNIPDITLLWMISQLQDLMGIHEQQLDEYMSQSVSGAKSITDSMKGIYKNAGVYIREPDVGSDSGKEFIHSSVRKFQSLTQIESIGDIFPQVLKPNATNIGGIWTWETAKREVKVPEDIPTTFEASKLASIEQTKPENSEELGTENETDEESGTDEGIADGSADEGAISPAPKVANPASFNSVGARDIKKPRTVRRQSLVEKESAKSRASRKS
jgi:uncharacterized protein (DUF2235 family)